MPLWNTNYTPSQPPYIASAPPSTWPDVVPGPEGDPIPTWHIDENGIISLFIPNDPEPRPFKDILIQITSDKAPGLPSANGVPGAASGVYGYPQSEWYTYTFEWHLEPNPPYEIIEIPVIFSTNIEEIVIDTICYIPEPAILGSMAMIAGGLLLRRHR